ncbi:MAG TPA: mechanosensitive ion channel family protein [Terracidiphilus sp.]|nr:mechanosensitive ion channel family protein [Terracidiphilus sp.]
MAIPPAGSAPGADRGSPILGRARYIILIVLLVLLALSLTFALITRDAMQQASFLRYSRNSHGVGRDQGTLVDTTPWKTARILAQMAVTAEENDYARRAEHLADHEVDQAFASSLRLATLSAQHQNPTGRALQLSQRIAQLQELIKEDQIQVQRLSAKAGRTSSSTDGGGDSSTDSTELDVAKAQLGLDSDQLADAQQDMARASGDQTVQIQQELAAHEEAMRQYDNEVRTGVQVAAISTRQHGTLAGRMTSWFNQRSRNQLIEQAMEQAQTDEKNLTDAHNALEAKANAAASSAGPTENLDEIRSRRAMRQILGIYDDRIETERQLATVYDKWSAQVTLQHRIVLHLMLRSITLILFIVICTFVCTSLVGSLMSRLGLERRQFQTLRTMLELGIQVVGALLILLVIFGAPKQTPTILGIATAGITIVMQDFILAFFGWFVLMGKNGIRVGDWVEINGVGGEVTDIGIISTTLLETGKLADTGHPTGRRITFINSFAIRGQFFNFSTSGQWMWDEIAVTVPASGNLQTTVEQINRVVQQETAADSRIAEKEWRHGAPGDSLSRFSTSPEVHVRPSGDDIKIEVRYVTRATHRFEMRNRLYERVVDLLRAADRPGMGGAPAAGDAAN